MRGNSEITAATGKSDRRPSQAIFLIILSCFFLSGVAGLIYQVLWIRMIDKVIGSAPFAVATVLSVFMGGLAVGSYVAGRYIDRVRSQGRLVALYGAMELVIGVYGLLIPLFIHLLKPLYGLVYNKLFGYFWIYQVFTFLGCSLLLVIPTALMGATLPILCRFYVAHLDHIGARTGKLYGINTVGAAIGALLCGFFLIKGFGVQGSLLVAAGLNTIVAVTAVLAGRGFKSLAAGEAAPIKGEVPPEHGQHPDRAPSVEDRGRTVRLALWIFAVSGFCAMAYEVIWTRLLGLIIGPTTYSFTIVISTFIVGLALGSVFFGWLGDRVKNVFHLLVMTQLGAACLALVVSQFLGNSQFFFAKLICTFQDRFGEMMLVQFLVLFMVLLGPTVLLGATFPLVNRIYARSMSMLGESIGSAYALNTVGAILGSFVAGFILIPVLGKENGLRLVTTIQFFVALGAVTFSLTAKGRRASRWILVAAVAVIGVALFVRFPSWNRRLLSYGHYRQLGKMEGILTGTSWFNAFWRGSEILARYQAPCRVVFYGDGIGGFTTVEKHVSSLGRAQYVLLNAGKPDASSHGDRSTQTLSAHIPMLFHPDPKKVMVLGLASGMTAGEVLKYPVNQLDILEISDQVVKASEFFKPWNNHCLSDPRVRLIVQDGRNHLALTREKYDVIISEPSNPWMAGLANLFTLEFFETARDRLNDGGIFVQWLQAYEMDWRTFSMVGRTFAKIFPDGLLMTTQATNSGDYLLVGFKGHRNFDLHVADRNIQYARRSNNLVLRHARALFHFIIAENLVDLFGKGPLHTDNWPRLEFSAPKLLYQRGDAIEEKLVQRRTRTPRTLNIVDGSTIDTFIDIVELQASVNFPIFGVVDLEKATPPQKARYEGIVMRFCSEALLPTYEMFQDRSLAVACASVQSEKIRQYLQNAPDNGTAFYNLGVALLAMGKTQGAIGSFQKAVSLNPFDIDAQVALGSVLSERGMSEQALGYLLKAAKARPDDADIQNNVGAALLGLGRLDDAVQHLSKAASMKPGDADVHNNLGVAFLRLERFDDAEAQFLQAQEIDHDSPDFRENLQLARRLKSGAMVSH